MSEIKTVLNEWIDENLKQMILSNSKDVLIASKAKIRPVIIKGEVVYQETLYQGTKVLHTNYGKEELLPRLEKMLGEVFRQGEIQSENGMVTILISKKGKVTVNAKRKNVQKHESDGENVPVARLMEHNRVKNYILEEGVPVDFLVGLGVQTKDGKIVKAKYDKFKQINRYLEFIEDIIPKLPKDKTLRIIDFGCGKSYLTFAMYYYLHKLKKYPVDITGLDLKTDVIERCNGLAREYGYDHLHFEKGDISTYEGADSVDMVVTLHACDTATDYALEKAIKWGALVIMAVPCCQHEVNKQISCEPLNGVLRYGLIKERMSALITDALRADMLEEMGYDAQILEFIDMEHTPKNILIRAVKKSGMQKRGSQKNLSVKETCEFLNISTTLQKLLEQE
ncbi:MAG: methyltransferase [Lachnospiraceae bacterium]|nr:methyltransferase [Lachnospiraceae bacterium]